ncbi:aminopeptidase N-like [Carcharodon carcharias]|uniref:aminopeptidase N-like n=1 Tax=Carcharodon carcharias TaxID=13397 RepID=UPI001B7E98F1|nr:aminopeptidase N-like [Carcharodon carcharias]
MLAGSGGDWLRLLLGGGWRPVLVWTGEGEGSQRPAPGTVEGHMRGGDEEVNHQEKVMPPRAVAMETTWIGKALTVLGLIAVVQASPNKRAPQASLVKALALDEEPWNVPYLPSSLRPINYEVQLWPWLFRESSSGLYLFHGRSIVTFECLETTDVIIIHSRMLNYTEPMRVSREDNSTIGVKSYWEEMANEYLVLLLGSPLWRGKVYRLQTAFRGELTDELQGLYRSDYEEDGTTKFLALTMLQPTDARRIFPCFDEPALKATFDLTVIHRPDHSAISNMPINRRSEMWIRGQMWIVTTFDRTLKMSSYLLACVISEFRFIEETHHGVTERWTLPGNRAQTPQAVFVVVAHHFQLNFQPVEALGVDVVDRLLARVQSTAPGTGGKSQIWFKVWGRKQLIDAGQGDHALKAAAQLLNFYEQKYDIFYPLTKLDLVAVPSFESGGMENWGMIIFREINLLYDPKEDSEGSQQNMILVLAHELTHQWFGNLVTMKWWNDIWLNEGVATYFSYLGNSFINPEWAVDPVFVGRSLVAALSSDALANSHPLSPKQQEVSTIEHISQLFDDITYEKGASVLRMVSNFLSEKVFLKGLVSYLKEFSFKTATYADLCAHLHEALNNQLTVKLPSNLKPILDTWILQMGYPVVTINTTSGLITQKHFLLDGRANVTRSSNLGYKWYIPITWQKNSSVQDTVWISRTNAMFVEQMQVNDQTWILANINAVGLYRVNYDNDNWDKLLILLMRNRDVSVSIFSWNNCGVGGSSQVLGRAGFTQEVVSGIACSNGLEECNRKAKGLYSRWMAQPDVNSIPPSLRSVIYCRSVSEGGEAEWEFAWRMLERATTAVEAQNLRYSLACSVDDELLTRPQAYHYKQYLHASHLMLLTRPQAYHYEQYLRASHLVLLTRTQAYHYEQYLRASHLVLLTRPQAYHYEQYLRASHLMLLTRPQAYHYEQYLRTSHLMLLTRPQVYHYKQYLRASHLMLLTRPQAYHYKQYLRASHLVLLTRPQAYHYKQYLRASHLVLLTRPQAYHYKQYLRASHLVLLTRPQAYHYKQYLHASHLVLLTRPQAYHNEQYLRASHLVLLTRPQAYHYEQYLSFTLMPWKIKQQDALATIILVAQNINGKKPAWDFIKDNWASIVSKFKMTEVILGLLDGVTSRFSTDEDLQELKAFKLTLEASGYQFASRILTKAIERTTSYIQWRKDNEGEIYQWVHNNL